MASKDGDEGSGSVTKVDQPYRDYANAREEDELPGDSQKTRGSGANGRGEQNFPFKLHYMLSDLEKDGLDHIVSWQPHGRCFVVHKQKEFVKHILPL